VLAETVHVPEMVGAVTKYAAQRMIERERTLADVALPTIRDVRQEMRIERRRRRMRALKVFLLGLFAGFATLVAAALITAPKG
jgi:hypothetical protein